jgi:hypothetical protein
MKHMSEAPKQQTQPSNARPYRTPQISLYGTVRQLTNGGSAGLAEGKATTNPNKAMA